MKIGAWYQGGGVCSFTVWAPLLRRLDLRLVSPVEKVLPMEKDGLGYWRVKAEGGIPSETRYLYRIDDAAERPDPASLFQPEGVHGPSQVLDHGSSPWDDREWKGIPLSRMIIYELHVGTFTPEGTFDAIVPRLDALADLGINAVEVMPVSQFPGERNWGYDGAFPYAVQNSYGGPAGLKNLVNECHKRGLAVILDVVYNHLGPEGNYLRDFGPYFTDRYRTPWGDAINFDGPYSDGVRNFFIENALHWFRHYHVDALRIDAVHGITDMSAEPFLRELSGKVGEFSAGAGRTYYLIAESDLNDARVISPPEMGGYGLDSQWNDDFHHALHTLLTGEQGGYYADFGKTEHLIKALREGFVYSGGYSQYRKRRHGNSSKGRPASQFIVCSQNHDQTGNRMEGERMPGLVSFESLKLAAGMVILSPYVPLLFMGEEYGETAPFLYFVSHSDPVLVEAVRQGRKEEFNAFSWKGEPPDPQDIGTFLRSKIDWNRRESCMHKILLDFYRRLLEMRKKITAISRPDKDSLDVCSIGAGNTLFLQRWDEEDRIAAFFNFAREDLEIRSPLDDGVWEKIIDSAETRWKGPGALLPDVLNSGAGLGLRRESLAVYRIRCTGMRHGD